MFVRFAGWIIRLSSVLALAGAGVAEIHSAMIAVVTVPGRVHTDPVHARVGCAHIVVVAPSRAPIVRGFVVASREVFVVRVDADSVLAGVKGARVSVVTVLLFIDALFQLVVAKANGAFIMISTSSRARVIIFLAPGNVLVVDVFTCSGAVVAGIDRAFVVVVALFIAMFAFASMRIAPVFSTRIVIIASTRASLLLFLALTRGWTWRWALAAREVRVKNVLAFAGAPATTVSCAFVAVIAIFGGMDALPVFGVT